MGQGEAATCTQVGSLELIPPGPLAPPLHVPAEPQRCSPRCRSGRGTRPGPCSPRIWRPSGQLRGGRGIPVSTTPERHARAPIAGRATVWNWMHASGRAKRWTGGSDAPVGGSTDLSTNTKIAFSGVSLMRRRITYTNCPTVRSPGTRYSATTVGARAASVSHASWEQEDPPTTHSSCRCPAPSSWKTSPR